MKLFSTSSLLIPRTLNIIITLVIIKIDFLLFRETKAKKDVIFDYCSFLRLIFFIGAKFRSVGNKVKVIIKDVIKPSVIIQPKSMMGFIPLKINDKKANTVVKTV